MMRSLTQVKKATSSTTLKVEFDMGPRDSKTGKYLFNRDAMSAHWLHHDDSEALYIIGRDEHNFKGYGADDNVESSLTSLTERELDNEALMESKGFALVPDPLRRFSVNDGYFAG